MLISQLMAVLSGRPVDFAIVLGQVLSSLFVIFICLPLHEFAHGWTANKLGDPTAKLEGRLTFNPLASVDVMGAAMLIFFGFGWARPVPVNANYFKNPKAGMAITALAGPLSNVIAAFAGALIYFPVRHFFPASYATDIVIYIIYFYVVVNVTLAIFNLIPIPPLDGSKILMAFLGGNLLQSYLRYQRAFGMLLFILLFAGALSTPITFARSYVENIIFAIARIPYAMIGIA